MDPDTLDPEVVLLLKKQQEDEINEGALKTAADLALNNARIEADIDAIVERVGKGAPLHPADAEEVRQYWSQYKIYYQYMAVDRTTHGFYFRSPRTSAIMGVLGLLIFRSPSTSTIIGFLDS